MTSMIFRIFAYEGLAIRNYIAEGSGSDVADLIFRHLLIFENEAIIDPAAEHSVSGRAIFALIDPMVMCPSWRECVPENCDRHHDDKPTVEETFHFFHPQILTPLAL